MLTENYFTAKFVNSMNIPQQYARPATAHHQQRLDEFMEKLNALRDDYPEMYLCDVNACGEIEVSILDDGKFVDGVSAYAQYDHRDRYYD